MSLPNLPKITDKNTYLDKRILEKAIHNLPRILKSNINKPIINLYESDWTAYTGSSSGNFVSTPTTYDPNMPLPFAVTISQQLKVNIPDEFLPFVNVSVIVDPGPNGTALGMMEADPSTISGAHLTETTVTSWDGFVFRGAASTFPYPVTDVTNSIAFKRNVWMADLYFTSEDGYPMRVRGGIVDFRSYDDPNNISDLSGGYEILQLGSTSVTVNSTTGPRGFPLNRCVISVYGIDEVFYENSWIFGGVTASGPSGGLRPNYHQVSNLTSGAFSYAFASNFSLENCRLYGYYPCLDANKNIRYAPSSNSLTGKSSIGAIPNPTTSFTSSYTGFTVNVSTSLSNTFLQNPPDPFAQLIPNIAYGHNNVKFFKHGSDSYTINLDSKSIVNSLTRSPQNMTVSVGNLLYSNMTGGAGTYGVSSYESSPFGETNNNWRPLIFNSTGGSSVSVPAGVMYNAGGIDVLAKIRIDIINPLYYLEEKNIERTT